MGHFCLPARGILENTTVAVLVANDPPTRRSIGVRVSPKVLFSASQMPLSYGRFVRLSAVPIPGRPDGSIVFESGTPSGWRAIRVVRRVGPGGVWMYWHTEPGTKALRARFLANATHEGGTSPVVTLLVR